MDIQFLKELMKEFKECELTKLELKQEDFQIKLEKKREVHPVALPAEPKTVANTNLVNQPQGHELVSPMVGTAYLAPSPDAPPFVIVGQKVKKGDVVCIIEAMKLMNEVEADMDGEVVEVIVENEQMVQFGEPLFIIRP